MDMFVENFKLHTAEPVAKFLAFNVEASINGMFSADRDLKAYRNKAQSLAFNLKKNEVRFLHVVFSTTYCVLLKPFDGCYSACGWTSWRDGCRRSTWST